MSRPSSPPPVDHAIEGVTSMFDRWYEIVAPTSPGPIDAIEVRYLEHRPGVDRTVQLRVTVGVERHLVAVASSATRPEPDVTWYPEDPGLPGLASGWRAIADDLGLPVDAPPPLAWVPGRRLVVGVGDRIVKFHSDPCETEFAVNSARAVAAAVRLPEVVAVDAARAVHVQERVGGTPLGAEHAHDDVADAMRLVRPLHEADLRSRIELPVVGPADLLALCLPVAALTTFYRPEWRQRVSEVVDALTRSAPTELELRTSHGDFNIGQIVRRSPTELVLVDIDTLCRAPVAFDLASYAANLVSGRDGDLERAERVLAAAVEAYGASPAGTDWYLAAMVLRRLDRSIRRHKRRWPERTERALESIERLIDR